MSTTAINESTRKPLRIWPAAAILAIVAIARFVVPAVAPDAAIFGIPVGIIAVLAGAVGALGIIIWWLFFSRAPWSDRIGAVILMGVALFVSSLVVHESIRGGMMGMMVYVFVPQIMALAFGVAVVISHRWSARARRIAMCASIALACAATALVRTDGITGAGESQLQWRWTPTAEERLLAQASVEPAATASAPATTPAAPSPPAPETAPAKSVEPKPIESTAGASPAKESTKSSAPEAARDEGSATNESAPKRAAWGGFRGPERDGVIRGVQIATDWSHTPPVEMWRKPIGPGWSSFAVQGDRIYTQEQRGDDELVSCYSVSTGEPVWRHRDKTRFWESNGGPGPRGTPTLHGDRVYTFGATGVVNALDANTGAIVWTRNASTDTGVEIPEWGFSSSPLVVNDVVVIAAGGQLIAYDARSGDRRWLGPNGGAGYSSPHLVTIDDVAQVVLLRGSRTISVSPRDGTLLWEHVWVAGVGIVQPAVAGERDVLLTTGDAMGGLGIRRVSVSKDGGAWKAEERWTSRGLKPYFNDFVVHKGHAFGFDGNILSAIDLADGERKWKGGRYGAGQMMLLPDQDLLLVLSEDGEIVLVSATPDQFREIARVPALNSKTWNHPAMAGDVLLVRNGEEMAAFRLPAAAR